MNRSKKGLTQAKRGTSADGSVPFLAEHSRDLFAIRSLSLGFSSFPEHVFLFRDKIALLWLWEARAYERLHGVALALERVRLRTGSLPETLAGLVPDYIDTIPTDPYNGQAIRYSHNEGGYLLYCVGYNLADDGGVAYRTERRKQMEKGDVVFAVHPNPATLRGQAIGGPALE